VAIKTSIGEVNIRILRFQTRLTTLENGEIKSEDWVHYCAPGQAERAVNVKRVARILKAIPEREVPYAIRQVVEPAYAAWKAGREVPLDGTPLGAWPGVQAEQVEVLQMAGVKTVEQVRDLTEGELTRIKLPELRSLKVMAERFLVAKDGGKVTEALAQKDKEIADLRASLEELAAMVKADKEQPEKRGPGRPRKEEAAA
jgi:hypothetical protein